MWQTQTITKLILYDQFKTQKFKIRYGGRTPYWKIRFLAITPQLFVRFARNFVQRRKNRPE